jgi:hypothetical protein
MFTHIVDGDPDYPLAPHSHSLVSEAITCEEQYAEDVDGAEQARAEAYAEERYERWLEDGGAHAAVIQHENDQERWMESMYQ